MSILKRQSFVLNVNGKMVMLRLIVRNTNHKPNNLFKSDSQRVAFLLCVAFSV
ncbi:hypothetical protein THOE12_280018 [Vibrio rotiferianus]|nr:hypothetical protein THOE12_280018 [Vibrio rotiferianus]